MNPVYSIERARNAFGFTIKNAITGDLMYKFRRTSDGYVFYRKCAGGQHGEELWRIKKQGIFNIKFMIHYCQGCVSKKEAKKTPPVGQFKAKIGWFNRFYLCTLHDQVVLNWRISTSLFGSKTTAKHGESDQGDPILALVDSNLSSSKCTIYLDPLLKQYPAFANRKEELETFILFTALVAKWEQFHNSSS